MGIGYYSFRLWVIFYSWHRLDILLVELLYMIRNYRAWALSISFSVLLVAPAVWEINLAGNHFSFILSLFNGASPQVFFPVFPWLSYPLVGHSIGSFFGNKKDFRFYLVMFLAGAA